MKDKEKGIGVAIMIGLGLLLFKNKIFGATGYRPTGRRILKGDLNKDGVVDISDVILAKRASVNPTAEQILIADMNGDGKITDEDVEEIQKVAVGLRKPEYIIV